MITKDYKTLLIQRASTIFLQVAIVALGVSALAFMLWEPHVEGVNAEATTLHEIYFDDPFLVYIYIGTIPFFVALYQAFMLLGHIRQNKVFSLNSVKALRTIKYCAVISIAFLVGAEGYINIVGRRTGDDIAGGVMMGLVMIFISVIVATTASVLERILQNVVDIMSRNDSVVK